MVKNYLVNGYSLDDYQMQLLNSNQNTIVIAGAGAGKTLTIIGKINYLIENKLAKAEEILVISFTNASVNDIKRKLEVPSFVFTFHKLAMYILDKINYNYTITSSTTLRYIIEEKVKTASLFEQKLILKFLHLKIKYSLFLKAKEFISFCNLIETFINLWKTNNLSFKDIPLTHYHSLEKNILLYIFNIYKDYMEEKKSNNSLDFDDLILLATKNISQTNLSFKYIIIDEFQDTSFLRLNLIRAIYQLIHPKIIVVGDDWQSIYRFSGCNLNIFLNFSTYFPDVLTIKLVNTYRNSQELINLAADFVMKNPLQISKSLISFKNITNPLIFVPYKNKITSFKFLLKYLLNISDDIMILGRNNKDVYDYIDQDFEYDNNILKFHNKLIRYLTVHRSKGLESEYVIVLNCNNSTLGFPNKIENNILINKLYKDSEIPFAEERRLFYVAITRCKVQTFLMYDKSNPSIFITEIKKIVKKHLKKIKYFKTK